MPLSRARTAFKLGLCVANIQAREKNNSPFPSCPPCPRRVETRSWAEEPLQRGSYSYFPLGARGDDIHKAGQGAAFGALGAGPGTAGSERVFFAGEATVPGMEGSMHGAYLSGIRAVEDIEYAFGPPL